MEFELWSDMSYFNADTIHLKSAFRVYEGEETNVVLISVEFCIPAASIKGMFPSIYTHIYIT